MKNVANLILAGMISLSMAACETGKYNLPQIEVNPALLRENVEALTSITPARNFQNLASINRAAEIIRQKFSAFGYQPAEQQFRANSAVYKNIIASFGPEEGPVFVVGAHYDVFGEQPGADDNASGVAGLLELARLVHKYKPELKYRLDFVAYSLEEPPFFRSSSMGSYQHARKLQQEAAEVLGMVSIEMIGYFSEEENSQEYPVSAMKLIYPTVGDFIAVVGNLNSSSLVNHFYRNCKPAAVKVEKLITPIIFTGVDSSDHLNYWKHGYKAVMVTDTSYYRNFNYHSPADDISTLDFDRMQEVVRGMYWALVNLPVKN